ncbi:MAG TPA: aminoglycoside phosphotransferase family protein, partial [Agromyces mariniharenae]|nr:aminoglycoside phosphotransferase family protein [Agromyces mariniharenae]
SITKNRQSTQVLRAILERAYGADRVPEGEDFASELGHGWFNVAYRLRLRDGAEVVLKVAPPPDIVVMTYERAMMRNELTAIALVQEHTTVPVPRVDFADTSGELIDAAWFVMPYVDADNMGILAEHGELTPLDEAMYGEQLGAANRELNSIVGSHFGPLRGPGFPSWRAAFTAMIEDVLQDGERADVDLGVEYDLIRQVISRDADALDGVTEPRFVEWDLWSSNVMIRDGRIAAIIDHERAFFGDPLIEAGFTGTDLPAFGDPTAFLRGYSRGPLTEEEQRRRRLYTLYLVLIMIIETRYRGHQDTRQFDWARERLAELMAQFGRTS